MSATAQALPAQFTTVVAPPPREVKPSVPRSMRSDTTIRDTSAANRLQEMSAWVDSAAVAMGIRTAAADSLTPTVPADTTGGPVIAAQPVDTIGGPVADTAHIPRETTPRRTESFRDGAPAPDTATPFPLLALLGASLIGAGMLLRRK
ncbi:MAG: hypothetical protein ACR2HZ_01260 [Gemmatimonadaceae bacterium]